MAVSRRIVKRKPKRRRIANGKAGSRKKRRARTTSQHGQLLPGLPDDITVTKILPKLPWAMIRTFAVVSREWSQALRNGIVFEARVSAESTETMFVSNVGGTTDRGNPQFFLYSVQDNSVYSLPRIPGINPGTSANFTYKSVNGILYVFGRTRSKISSQIMERWGSSKLYELYSYKYDLARHGGGWRQCANPGFLGVPFESAVMNGKIFVWDSRTSFAWYDPDADVWSPIMSRPLDRLPCRSPIMSYGDGSYQKILPGAGIEEDLVYQYGYISNSGWGVIEWIKKFRVHFSCCAGPFFSFPWSIHTKSAEQEVKSGKGIVVAVIGGIFLKLTRQRIDAYDCHTNTWTPLHFEGPFEFFHSNPKREEWGRPAPYAVDVAVVRAKKEMYALVERWDSRRPNCISSQPVLMKSEISDQGNEWRDFSSNQQNVGRSAVFLCSKDFWAVPSVCNRPGGR